MPSKASDAAASGTPELITDPVAAKLLGVGITRFHELQKRAGFPSPVWLGQRGKRHVRAELIGWALTQRTREAA